MARLVRPTLSAALAVAAVVAGGWFSAATASGYGTQSWSVTSDIGVKTRSSANQDAVVGYGPPAGEQLTDLCQVLTDSAVGEYGNRLWHLMARSDGQRTWVNDHWLDSPNKANQYTPGTPTCAGGEGTDPGIVTSDSGEDEWQPDCSPDSTYIDRDIEVEQTDQGRIIHLRPTAAARDAADSEDWDITVEMWHAIQACVPGLYDKTADSVWQQLDCHQRYSDVWNPRRHDWATGSTYDLETWHPALEDPNWLDYVLSKCGNGRLIPVDLTYFAYAS